MIQLKTFSEWLKENYTSGMDVPDKKIKLMRRNKLPNITNFDSFYEDLITSGFDVKEMSDNADNYIPTQNEFNDEKVQRIIRMRKKLFPIIVSNDNYIVDGHHRWKAALVSKQPILVKKVNMNYNDLFNFLKNKPYIVNKKIHEQESK